MKHIKATLDFIPVEERLPDYECDVLARYIHIPSGDKTIIQASYVGNGNWEDITGMICTNDKYRVTHWAEIPVLDSGK